MPVIGTSGIGDGDLPDARPDAPADRFDAPEGPPQPARWVLAATAVGLLIGPLADLGCRLAFGQRGTGPRLPASYCIPPLLGVGMLLFALRWIAARTLQIPPDAAARWTALTVASGSAGWAEIQARGLGTGGSPLLTATEWLLITLPYPAVATVAAVASPPRPRLRTILLLCGGAALLLLAVLAGLNGLCALSAAVKTAGGR